MNYFGEYTLEALARKAINKLNPSLYTSAPAAIPIEEMIEQAFNLNLLYLNIRNDGRILGETVFEDTPVVAYDKEEHRYILIEVPADTIIIESRLLQPKYTGRYRFTCAHELAHYILHKELFLHNNDIAALDKVTLSSKSNNAIEKQANMLATCILMPMPQVKKAIYEQRSVNEKDTIARLSDIFKVSKQAMEIRLREHNLI